MVHLIQIIIECCMFLFQLTLRCSDGLVGDNSFRKLFIGIRQILFKYSSVSVSLFQESPCLFQSILVSIGLSLSRNQVVLGNILGPRFLLKLGLNITNLQLVFLNSSLSLSIVGVCMFKSNLKVSNISLKLLFHPKSFSLSLGFNLKSRLHTLNSSGLSLPNHHKFIILLCQSALNLLPDLGQFQLRAKNLVFLLFQGSFGFLKSSLQLHLFSLQ